MESGHRVSIPLKHWQKYVLCSLAPVKWKRLVRQESTHHTEEYNKEWTRLATKKNSHANWLIIPSLKCQEIVKLFTTKFKNPNTEKNTFLLNYCLKWLADYDCYQFIFLWSTDRLIGFSVSALKKWIKPKTMLNTRTSWPFGSHFGVNMQNHSWSYVYNDLWQMWLPREW